MVNGLTLQVWLEGVTPNVKKRKTNLCYMVSRSKKNAQTELTLVVIGRILDSRITIILLSFAFCACVPAAR